MNRIVPGCDLVALEDDWKKGCSAPHAAYTAVKGGKRARDQTHGAAASRTPHAQAGWAYAAAIAGWPSSGDCRYSTISDCLK